MLVMGDVNAATCRKLFEDQFTLSTTVNDTSAVVDLSVSVRTYKFTCVLMRRKQISRFLRAGFVAFPAHFYAGFHLADIRQTLRGLRALRGLQCYRKSRQIKILLSFM